MRACDGLRTSGECSSETSTARPSALLRFLQHEPDHRIGTAEGLEAAEAEAVAFVLDVDRADADFGGQCRQSHERRLRMVVAKCEVALDLVGGLHAEGFGIASGRAACGSRDCCSSRNMRASFGLLD